jgi:hypothetical protein
MCIKPNLQRLYILSQIPCSLARPIPLGILKATPRTDALYTEYLKRGERLVATSTGLPATLTPRDIERWGFAPPHCCANVTVMKAEIPRILI